MSDKKLRDVSAEDLEAFKTLLVSHYGLSWEKSLVRFEQETAALLGRDINRAYRQLMDGEMHDLVGEVFERYARVYGRMRRAGTVLDSFEAMHQTMVKYVRAETLRRYARRLRDINPDDIPDQPHPDAPIDRELEDKEERLILLRCQRECLMKLPEHILTLLFENYNTDLHPPGERAEMRRKLALRLSGLSAEEATPEEVRRAKNKVDSKISKWRNEHLQPCLERCLKRAKSPRWPWRGRR